MTLHLLVLFGVFFGALLARFPVFLAALLSVVTYALAFSAMSPTVLIQTLNQGLDKTLLTAIPLFYLTGTIMNAGGMTARLVRLASALLVQFRGGLSHVNIGASMLFGGLTGSAVADVSAIGSTMIPAMKANGYPPAYAAAVTAASAPIGLLIPPSIPMVLFGLFNDAPIDQLFLAGILPGLMMGTYLLVVSTLIANQRQYPKGRWLGWQEVRQALNGCIFALVLPLAVVVSMVTGVAAVSEIGALAVAYAVIISVFVYKEVSLKQLWATAQGTAVDAARILAIIAVAGAPLWIFSNLGVDAALGDLFASFDVSKTQLLAIVAALLVVTGTVVGVGIQLILFVPIATPILLEAGVPILQIGMVCVLGAAIGMITPPIGILIFLTAAQAGTSVMSVVRELVPFVLAITLLLAALIFFPSLSTGMGLLGDQ